MAVPEDAVARLPLDEAAPDDWWCALAAAVDADTGAGGALRLALTLIEAFPVMCTFRPVAAEDEVWVFVALEKGARVVACWVAPDDAAEEPPTTMRPVWDDMVWCG